tara:strand:+ start:763 stop:966 length:204 start_codon:yes stop_codon:yes gene_type:complete
VIALLGRVPPSQRFYKDFSKKKFVQENRDKRNLSKIFEESLRGTHPSKVIATVILGTGGAVGGTDVD